MNTGIYRIEMGNYFYIGQSTNLNKRKHCHSSELQRGVHSNSRMQNVYSKYKEFDFSVIVYAESHMLDDIEQGLIDVHYEDKNCMNLARNAINPRLGVKCSPETLVRMSNAMKGNVPSKVTRTRISESMTSSDIYSFVHKDGTVEKCTKYELRMKYNLNSGNMSKLASGKRKSCNGWRVV